MDACEVTRRLVEYYNGKGQLTEMLQQRIAALQECLARMSDPPQSDGDCQPGRGVVDQTIDALDKRLIGRSDRTRLRNALDKADAPLTGIDAQNAAVVRMARMSGTKTIIAPLGGNNG